MTQVRYTRRFIDPRHQYRRWVDPRYRSLPVADVVSYLEARGWKKVLSDRPAFLVFEEPATPAGEEPFYQFVPDSETSSDYGQRMFELLTGVAEAEDRQASAVIDDILRHAGERRQVNGMSGTPQAGETQGVR
jgi:hypothetical protein